MTNRRWQIPVKIYNRMVEQGFFRPEDKVELLRGELVQKMPIGSAHAAVVTLLHFLLMTITNRAIVRVQNPIELVDSVPEPDLAIVKRQTDFYFSHHPVANDVYLLIEVSESTIDEDRSIKAPLYAENNIPEYWIVNLNNSTVEVYRQPQNGIYMDIRILQQGDLLEIQTLPGFSLTINQFMP